MFSDSKTLFIVPKANTISEENSEIRDAFYTILKPSRNFVLKFPFLKSSFRISC
jgi:hypothetical protein